MMALRFVSFAIALSLASGALADAVRVGVLAPLSGPFAMYGKQFREAIEVYRKQNGDKAGGHTVEIVYRDLTETNPALAKALAQELVVKDKVQYLAGVVFTPNALAIAPLAEEAKVPFVVFNAATSAVTAKSNYVTRTSYTL